MSNFFKIKDLIRMGVTVKGTNVKISKLARIYNPHGLTLHDNVRIDDFTILSGRGKIEIGNFVHIGPHCFIAAAGFCYHDVPAFVTASGNPAEPRTINREGMKRRGFSPDEIALANKAYKLLFRRGLNIDDAIKAISELGDNRVVAMVLGSVENSTRGIIR